MPEYRGVSIDYVPLTDLIVAGKPRMGWLENTSYWEDDCWGRLSKPAWKSQASEVWTEVCRLIELPKSHTESEEETRYYGVPLSECFKNAVSEYPRVAVDPKIMAGAPCVAGTRIPVYLILAAIEANGIDGALASYPCLTRQQIVDAVGFAKVVLECPIEHEVTPPRG